MLMRRYVRAPAEAGWEEAEGRTEFRNVLYFFRRRWPIIALAVALMTVLATAFVAVVTPVYTASSQILLTPPRDRTVGVDGTLVESAVDPAAVDTQISLLQSAALLRRVVDSERLTEDPEFSAPQSPGLIGRLLGRQRSDETVNDGAADPGPAQRATQALQEKVSIERVGRSYVLSIVATSLDRHKARRLADAVGTAYIADRIETRGDAIRRAGRDLRDARIINPANVPKSPSFPRRPLVFAVALVMGLFLGIGAALVFEALSSGFTRAHELERTLGVPLLTSLTRLSRGQRVVGDRVLHPANIVTAQPLTRFSEGVRSLRANLRLIGDAPRHKTIQITSSVPGEGKSTIALSLAMSAAAAGQRVAVIDADLRRGSITSHYKLEADPGLVGLLEDLHRSPRRPPLEFKSAARSPRAGFTFFQPDGRRRMRPPFWGRPEWTGFSPCLHRPSIS